MEQTLEQLFFGPYSREFCNYFYFLMIITFIFFIVAVIQTGYLLFKQKIGIVDGIMAVVVPFIMYFTERLMYSICISAIR